MKRLTLFLVVALLVSLCAPALASGTDEKPVVTTVFGSVGNRVLTFLADKGETDEDNRWTRLIEQQLGIDLQYQWVATSGEEFTQKLNLALASGDVPDFIPFNSLSQIYQASLSGYLMDAKPIFEQYASPLLKEIFALDNNVEFAACTFDGKLGAIPSIMTPFDSLPVLYIRKDWMDNLGIADPTSHADVLKIMEAFVTQDPDKNGANDTYAMGIGGEPFGGLYSALGFMAAYDAFPGIWYAGAEGDLIYGSVQPTMKKGIAALHDMFEKGWIDPEFVVNDTSEKVVNGKIGVVYGPDYVPWFTQASHDYDGAMWYSYPLMHETEKYAKTQVTSATWQYYGISAKAQHPEALVQMLNLYAEKIWGETAEGDIYFGAGDAEGMWHLAPFGFLHPYNNYLITDGIRQALETGSTQGIFPPAVGFHDGVLKYRAGDEKAWANEFCFAPTPYSSIGVTEIYRDNNTFLYAAKAWTQAEEDRGAICQKLITDSVVKMIMGEESVDKFDDIVQEWYSLGGEQIRTEMNNWYAGTK